MEFFLEVQLGEVGTTVNKNQKHNIQEGLFAYKSIPLNKGYLNTVYISPIGGFEPRCSIIYPPKGLCCKQSQKVVQLFLLIHYLG